MLDVAMDMADAGDGRWEELWLALFRRLMASNDERIQIPVDKIADINNGSEWRLGNHIQLNAALHWASMGQLHGQGGNYPTNIEQNLKSRARRHIT
jgi:hypothetical protein